MSITKSIINVNNEIVLFTTIEPTRMIIPGEPSKIHFNYYIFQFILKQNNVYFSYERQQQRRISREESFPEFAFRDSGLTEEVSELLLTKSASRWELSLPRFALFKS